MPLTRPSLSGNDKATADFIDHFLASKGSPAAQEQGPNGMTTGEMMVDAGHKNNVDPLVLLSIAGQETGFGKLGVGMQKWMGVTAYDNNPTNKNPGADGVANQIYVGAKTFANLRDKAGVSADAPLNQQIDAVNRAGWATDGRWHAGVEHWYSQIAQSANSGGRVA
jgi:hypothetical protein